MKISIKIFGLLIISIVALGCEKPRESAPLVKYRETQLLMGTVVQIDVCYEGADEQQLRNVYSMVWKKLADIDESMSGYKKNSEISRVNRSYPKAYHASREFYDVVKTSIEISKLTEGTFDITVQPLLDLWRRAEQENKVPQQKEIYKIKEAVDIGHIRLLPGNYMQILHPLAKINVGGIAKGYATDAAARIFRDNGFMNFFIDAGGDLYVGGHNCKKRPWRIGIRDPRNKSSILKIIEVSDAAIATSGDYERYYEIQGNRWSHIINPITGYPSKVAASATVVAPEAIVADALATALCVLGPQKGIALIDSLGKGYGCLIITARDEGLTDIHKSQLFIDLFTTK